MSSNFQENLRDDLEINGRPDWDTVFQSFSILLAARSTCDRTLVGCVVVSSDNTRVLAMGYNGNYSGGPNGCDSSEPGKCGCIHAEINALLKLDYHDRSDKIMYVTMSPCVPCAKAIINSGIKEVVYMDEYRTTEGLDVLNSAQISLRRIPYNRD